MSIKHDEIIELRLCGVSNHMVKNVSEMLGVSRSEWAMDDTEFWKIHICLKSPVEPMALHLREKYGFDRHT